jgi:hypothetical protein
MLWGLRQAGRGGSEGKGIGQDHRQKKAVYDKVIVPIITPKSQLWGVCSMCQAGI